MESSYFDTAGIASLVREGKHREIVGGLWDEIGQLQFSFLVERGLRPRHKLLDIGCGSLRGGVHFVGYLNKTHYFGIDISQALLDSGREEIGKIGFADRLPAENLRCSEDFDGAQFGVKFDFILAQSLFTHLSFNRIRRCLEEARDVLADDGVFYATFFERSSDSLARVSLTHDPGSVQTSDVRDPYHYSVEDFRYAARGLSLDVEYIGGWAHPRGQHILAFHSRRDSSNSAERALSFDLAAELPAGADHYRSYVGPPDRFDFMSATQFNLLCTLGLRDRHKVLDFGCGSLRLGRLLIPYLRPEKYFGIEPNNWLIEEAMKFELGQDVGKIKAPKFSFNSDFDCSVFGTTFDFVMAQSIVTHCGPDLFATLMLRVADVLSADGLFAFSYCEASKTPTGALEDGWVYPGVVWYPQAEIDNFVKRAGLVGRPIPWFHPGASWYVAARNESRLPAMEELRFLRGAVLHDPQFAASRSLA